MSGLSDAWRAFRRVIACRYARMRHAANDIPSALETARMEQRRANRRALGLLLTLLNSEQRQQFQQLGYFHVTGGKSGDCYRIRVDMIANIDLLCNDGRVKYRLCIGPAGGVPIYDAMAAQLLYLQDATAEERFLRQANIHPPLWEDRGISNPAWIV